jgi:3-dehydroquinate dehydratase II
MKPSQPTILILNGPNLNLLGRRDPLQYGSLTLATILEECRQRAEAVGCRLETFQSNAEGALIDRIHQAMDQAAAIIINAGAYSHTSHALRDALEAFPGLVVEVHLSNPAAREPFRHASVLAPVVAGQVTGLREWSYYAALHAVLGRLNAGE